MSFQFLLTQYLQSLAHWSAISTALAFLPAGAMVLVLSLRVAGLLDRFGAGSLVVAAFAALVAGYAVFLRAGVTPDYPGVMLPTVILLGTAFGFGFSALTVAATAGVRNHQQGLAASLFQTSFQVGGAVVLAVITAVIDAGGANSVISPSATLSAYRHWAEQSGGQAGAFAGDPGWTPERRFERLFERLSLPGFGRMGRYDLLVTLGRLGLYELRAGSLRLSGVGELSSSDLTTLAAKRLFAIGDPMLLERRAAALAEAIAVPLDTLDLALANWGSPPRATLGFPADTSDRGALERAHDALGL